MPSLDFVFKTCTGQDTAYWSERGQLDWFQSYADGSDAGKGILTADWNEFPRPGDNAFNWSRKGRRFQSILESLGYQLEWSDQTNRCEHCNGCITEGPDYHGDSSHYAILGECDIVCSECIRKDFQQEYLEGLEDNPRTAVSVRGVDPAKLGYIRIDTGFESGFHPGQTDDPLEISKQLKAQGYSRLVFAIDDSGQFDVRFSVWCHSKGLPSMTDWQRTLTEVYA